MRFSIETAILMAGVASAQNFRVVADILSSIPGQGSQSRTWYGDGNLYVGPFVPATVTNALNFTIPNYSSSASQPIVAPLPPATEADLPAGTFFAVNTTAGATDPFVFTNDESTLGEGYVANWLRYGTRLLPNIGSLESRFYLEPTVQPSTWIVTWRSPGTSTEGLRAIHLLAIL
ncbi:hypothetical protein S40285_10849 [Stachybotrys chlorohalonatus IBT 40285]|uniref:Uncharacterized protein n=1 Tax=Stachybotrys chlorohalonatus (strain IBT 40285) TaxID=1283841 RepID=A0A084Q850_STAC4|nr:hypothetical protein S40285_10849 [Stachybotrys chlorohalonata IBT 40285]